MKKQIQNTLFALLLIPFLFAGCDSLFDKGDTEKVLEVTQVGFELLEIEVLITAGTTSVDIQLIAPQRTADLAVNFSVDGGSTAVAGTHYELATGSPATIAAGASTVPVNITLIEDSLEPGEEVRLILNLDGTNDAGIDVAPNFRKTTIFIRG